MSMQVTMVRIYCTEGDHKLKELLRILHDREQVRGVTAFRGIAGFGRTGKYHVASLLDLATDLPVIVEFFDAPAKVETIKEHINTLVGPGRMVSWSAEVNDDQ